jgi:hypothetical protein
VPPESLRNEVYAILAQGTGPPEPTLAHCGSDFAETLAEAIRVWHADLRAHNGVPKLDHLSRRVNELVTGEWRRLCAAAGVPVLSSDADRDALYAAHNDCVKPTRVLSARFFFDIDEHAPVLGPPAVGAAELPMACLPLAARDGARPLSTNCYLRQGDVGQKFALAVAGTLPVLLARALEGPGPGPLAVDPALVYITVEAYMVEFFVYATVWRKGRHPHAGLAVPTT